MTPIEVRGPLSKPRLSEEEIAAKIAEHDRALAAHAEAKAEQDRAREKALRGIPVVRYESARPKPFVGGLLFGPPGTGKTHEAICRLLGTVRGVFLGARELVESSRAVEMDRATRLEAARVDRAYSATELVLDDLGTRRPTDFAIDVVCALVDHRWNAALPTLVTSNLEPSKLAELWGDRTLSRISGFGKFERVDGPDRRRS